MHFFNKPLSNISLYLLRLPKKIHFREAEINSLGKKKFLFTFMVSKSSVKGKLKLLKKMLSVLLMHFPSKSYSNKCFNFEGMHLIYQLFKLNIDK